MSDEIPGMPLPGSGGVAEDGEGASRSPSGIVRFLQGISVDLFVVSLCAYALLATLETIDPGWVSDFFNLDILLAVLLASGAFALTPFSNRAWPEAAHLDKLYLRSWVLILGAVGLALTWRTTKGLGVFSLMISLGSAAIIVFCCWLLDAGGTRQ